MKRILPLILLAGLWLGAWGQQAPQFSQYMFNELYLNPAYAGYKKDLYAHLLYRAQWVGLEGAPQTGLLSVDGTLGDRLNLGLQAYSERVGLLRNTSVLGSYAFRMPLGERTALSFGVGLGVYYASVDGSGYDPGDPNTPDPLLSGGRRSQLSPDASVGVYLSSDQYYVGLSGANLVSGYVGAPAQAAYQLPAQAATLYLSAGYLFYLTRDVKLKPSLLWKENFKNPTTVDLNLMLLLLGDRLWVGGSYRSSALLWKKSGYGGDTPSFSSSSASAIAEVFLTPWLRLGYAYDYSLTAVGGYRSSHEVSLGFYLLPRGTKLYTPRYF